MDFEFLIKTTERLLLICIAIATVCATIIEISTLIIDREVGLNRLGDILKKKNHVEIITPPSLPHHQPERAGVYLKQTVMSFLNLP